MKFGRRRPITGSLSSKKRDFYPKSGKIDTLHGTRRTKKGTSWAAHPVTLHMGLTTPLPRMVRWHPFFPWDSVDPFFSKFWLLWVEIRANYIIVKIIGGRSTLFDVTK